MEGPAGKVDAPGGVRSGVNCQRQRGAALEPPQGLINELFREEVVAARRMTPSEKLLEGAKLFDYACAITSAGIRHQYPDADDQRVLEILRGRLELARRLEESRER